MSGFGDNFGTTDEDPAAEFLAREQDELAGLEDEVKPAAISAPVLNGGMYVKKGGVWLIHHYFIIHYFHMHAFLVLYCTHQPNAWHSKYFSALGVILFYIALSVDDPTNSASSFEMVENTDQDGLGEQKYGMSIGEYMVIASNIFIIHNKKHM